MTGTTVPGHRWGRGARFVASSLSLAGGLKRSPSTTRGSAPEPLRSSPRATRREDAALPWEMTCPRGAAIAPSWGRCMSGLRLFGVQVLKVCAPERRQDPAACPCAAPICRTSQWLQIAPQPSARPPCAACTSHSPATRGTCRDAPKSDPPTRARARRPAPAWSLPGSFQTSRGRGRPHPPPGAARRRRRNPHPGRVQA